MNASKQELIQKIKVLEDQNKKLNETLQGLTSKFLPIIDRLIQNSEQNQEKVTDDNFDSVETPEGFQQCRQENSSKEVSK